MATQHQLTFETIAGLRHVTGRDCNSSDSDDTIQRPTNRGNKSKRKAEYVHEGQLDRPTGLKVYKKSITHAGYERAILRRNPKRYDGDGDELDDDDIDEMADAEAAARNPYSHIKLEELLSPLTSAANLPQHPSLSVPYVSDTLTDMTRQACTILHRERRSLSAAKNLLTRFRGDVTFIHSGSLNSNFDDYIFDVAPAYSRFSTVKVHLHPPKSPRSGPPDPQSLEASSNLASGTIHDETNDFVDNVASAVGYKEDGSKQAITNGTINPTLESPGIHEGHSTAWQAKHITTARRSEPERHRPNMATERIETRDIAVGRGITVEEVAALNVGQEDRLIASPLPLSLQQEAHVELPSSAGTSSNMIPDGETMNRSPEDRALPSPESLRDEPHTGVDRDAHDTLPATATVSNAEGLDMKGVENAEEEDVGDEFQPVPRRMRTRAQAQAPPDNSAVHTKTPSPASWVRPVIHPLYLMPESARPDRDYGLPPNEAEDTRRLLMAFVQKQEEVVRGAETLYEGLLRADRMRQTVYKWCKAEGHLGEMSDGEDWYDKDEWGLEEDLKKGQGDEEEDTITQGKKGRKTRQQQ